MLIESGTCQMAVDKGDGEICKLEGDAHTTLVANDIPDAGGDSGCIKIYMQLNAKYKEKMS